MTTPVTVTPEVLQAVNLYLCDKEGHMIGVNQAVGRREKTSDGRIDIINDNSDMLPYLFCSRCGKVWMVVDTPGNGYDDAENKLQDKLKATDDLSKKITQIRNNRKNPKPPKESTK